jgi:peroxiredoxin
MEDCRKIVLAPMTSALVVLVLSVTAAAQQAKTPQDLLKSIGLSKPVISRAPDFYLREANGGSISLAQYRGSLVLLNFWATWCAPCREEMPSMDHLHRAFGGRSLAVVAVNQRESAAQVTKFMRAHGLNFAAPLDSDGRVAASYRVYGIPVTYLIDANGQAIGFKSGIKDWAAREVVDALRKLIADSGRNAPSAPVNLEPAAPLPTVFRATSQGSPVYARQDTHSEVIGKLAPGEEVVLLGKVSGAGEFWYMVKTKAGVAGWLRGSEVEEPGRAK